MHVDTKEDEAKQEMELLRLIVQEKLIMLKQAKERERKELERELQSFHRNMPDSAGFAPEGYPAFRFGQSQNYAPQPEDIMLDYRF